MKRIYIALLAALCAVGTLSAQDFYDINTINTIDITFAEDNWDAILDQLYAAGDEDRLLGTVLINGVQYDSVGVRYKGNSTYSANRTKNPFNIKLDEIIEDQELEGYGTLKLANVYNDPTFVRETLGYEIAQKYMPASKANYAKVTVNGEYLGLYTSVQSVDKFFLGTHFNSNDNAFFKGELLGNSPQQGAVWGYLGEDSTSYFNYYELKSDEGWSDLINFLNVLNNDNEKVEEVLNVDRLLWMIAYDNLMVNLDAPINFAHNYYLYKDDAGQFNSVIWDLNENFGVFSRLLGSGGGMGGGGLSTTQMQQLDPFLNATSDNFPIISKILSNPLYQRMYIAHMKTIIEENFANDWYKTRGAELQDIVAAEVEADPNKFYTYNDFLTSFNTATTGGGGGGGMGGRSVVGITQLMDGRVSYLMNRSEFQATAPVVVETFGSVDDARTVTVTAEIVDGGSVWVYHRSRQNERFVAEQMYDDGVHGDEVAEDGLFGAQIEGDANTTMEYYIYVENSDAGTFSPARAAYEFYSLKIPGEVNNVVINEFLASNDVTVADPAGDYDDWIELYNNSDAAVSLGGYYLSDDGNDLMQWEFPEVVIPAGGYLIVWADDDDDQEGLHANFKISASGETLFLVDPQGNIVDEVTFGAQETDISTGRYPNGTGEFRTMPPTFNAENQISTSSVNASDVAALRNEVQMEASPNPFRSSTSISFTLPQGGEVGLRIVDLQGREVASLASGYLSAGEHRYEWDGAAESGLYYYILSVNGINLTDKLMLVR